MNQVTRFLQKLFRQIGTPRAKQLHQLIAMGEWDKAQSMPMPGPNAYRTAQEYRQDRIVTDIIKKLRLPGDEAQRKKATLAKYFEAEHANKLTNQRFRRYQKMVSGDILIPEDERINVEVLFAWRREVKAVLGRLPSLLTPSFSGGSTLSDHGKLTTIPDKMSSQPTIYESCIDIWAHSIQNTPFEDHPRASWRVVRANEFFMVPKDSSVNRACCLEASAPLSLQLAVGKILKARYKAHTGHDLRHAKAVHMDLARQGSRDGSLATIDLSSASDMIAKELVKAVLPSDWFELLNSLRATHTIVEGKAHYNEKFSSMGNGFTFELETILFRSLMAVLTDYDVRTFGDDIIIDSASADVALAALQWAGFVVNKKKTFCEGPFRESCGGDYFRGVPVRGHYLKELPDEPQDWMALANGLYRLGLARTAAWYYCVDQVPHNWRVFGPPFLEDLCFNDDDAEPTYRPGCDNRLSPYWPVMVPVGKKIALGAHFKPRVAMASAALGVPSMVLPRDSITGYRRRYVLAYGVGELPTP